MTGDLHTTFYKNRREASFFLSLPRMGKAIHTRGEAATTTPNPEPRTPNPEPRTLNPEP